MLTEKRQSEVSVIRRLVEEPYRFKFVQAVRLLLQCLRQCGVPYDTALAQVLRFQNSTSMAFPASEIEALAIDADCDISDDAALLAALQGDEAAITITTSFMGFLGANGTLPLHYSERVAAHEMFEHDDCTRAFLDTFSTRMVGLFFQAWGKYRVEHKLDVTAQDDFLPILMALGGVQEETFRHTAGGVNEDVAGFYTSLLRQRPVSASALACVLPDYFGVPITLEQFVGGWDDIADNRTSRLGGANARLGYSGALGVRKWRHDLHVNVRIGPLNKEDFERFLPGASGALALEKMLGLLGVPGIQYEAQLILRADCVEAATFGGGKRLGWDAFLSSGKAPVRDKDNVRYTLRPS